MSIFAIRPSKVEIGETEVNIYNLPVTTIFKLRPILEDMVSNIYFLWDNKDVLQNTELINEEKNGQTKTVQKIDPPSVELLELVKSNKEKAISSITKSLLSEENKELLEEIIKKSLKDEKNINLDDIDMGTTTELLIEIVENNTKSFNNVLKKIKNIQNKIAQITKKK